MKKRQTDMYKAKKQKLRQPLLKCSLVNAAKQKGKQGETVKASCFCRNKRWRICNAYTDLTLQMRQEGIRKNKTQKPLSWNGEQEPV